MAVLIRDLTEENIDSFEPILGKQISQNIGRKTWAGKGFFLGVENPCAAIAFSTSKDAWEDDASFSRIEGIAVKEDFRKQGLGRNLMEEMETAAYDEDVSRIVFEFPLETADESRKFFEAMEFELSEEEGRRLKIPVSAVAALPFVGSKKLPKKIRSIKELTLRQFERGVLNCVFSGREGILDDILYLPMDWFDPEFSCCMMMDGEVKGLLLVHEDPSGDREIYLLHAIGPDARKDILFMISFSGGRAVEKLSPDTNIIVERRMPYISAITDKLFPDLKGEICLKGRKDL